MPFSVSLSDPTGVNLPLKDFEGLWEDACGVIGPCSTPGGKGGETSLYSLLLSLLFLLCVCVDKRHYHRMNSYLAFFRNDASSTIKMIKEAIPLRNPENNHICLISVWAPRTCCPVLFVCSKCSCWITSSSALCEAHSERRTLWHF